MQLFQINQSEDSSKITIMFDNPSGQFHQRSITTAPTLPASSRNSGSDRSDVLYGTITSHFPLASSLSRQTTFCRNYVALIKAGIVAT